MSRALKISIALNVVLAAVCTFLLVWNLQQPSASAPVAPGSGASPAFDWKQLDAADFPTFVRNLRAAGCPEKTLRDIITGEVTEIYQEKERSLLASASGTGLEANAAGKAPPALTQLHAERDRTIAALLAPAPAAAEKKAAYSTASDASTPQQPANTSAATDGAVGGSSEAAASSPAPSGQTFASAQAMGTRPVYPAIYAHNASVAAMDAGLARASSRTAAAQATTPEQRAIADQITQKFVEAVGPTPQDPNDPAYRQRWDAAVQMSDKAYADHFGARALQKRQIEAAVQLAQQQAGVAK